MATKCETRTLQCVTALKTTNGPIVEDRSRRLFSVGFYTFRNALCSNTYAREEEFWKDATTGNARIDCRMRELRPSGDKNRSAFGRHGDRAQQVASWPNDGRFVHANGLLFCGENITRTRTVGTKKYRVCVEKQRFYLSLQGSRCVSARSITVTASSLTGNRSRQNLICSKSFRTLNVCTKE